MMDSPPETAFETVDLQKDGPVAHIVLNRPEVVNAYNVQMRDDLYQALEAVRDDPDVGAVVLRGAGERGFCAGADLTEFGTAPSPAVARQVRWERDIWGLFLSIRKPMVAALHGHVIGSGVEIACLCDIRVASEDAVFRMPETGLSLVPAAGGTQTLARVAGVGPAMEMLLTNSPVAAEDAQRFGLVHRVVAPDVLLDEAGRAARALAELDPNAVAAAKEALLSGADMPLDAALKREARLAETLAYS